MALSERAGVQLNTPEPLLMRSCFQWQVIPPPERSSKGFCVSGSGRLIDAANGPAWAAPTKHRHFYPEVLRRAACQLGTADACWKAGETSQQAD